MAAAQATDPDDKCDDPLEGTNPAAVELDRLGGKARAAKPTAEERSIIARTVAMM